MTAASSTSSHDRHETAASPLPCDVEKSASLSPPPAPVKSTGHSSLTESHEHVDDPPYKLVTWNVHGPGDDAEKVSQDPLDDPENPMTFGRRRHLIVAINYLCCLCVTATSSICSSGYDVIAKKQHVGLEVARLSVALYVLGLAVGPCFLGPFSEFYGRRPIYLISFAVYFLLQFPVAFANNPAVFFIFRFLSSAAGSSFLSIAAGSVTDMYDNLHLLAPIGLSIGSAPFCGPALGPIYSGFVVSATGKLQWSYYTNIIWSFLLWWALYFASPETYHPKLLAQRAARLRKETGDDRWKSRYDLETRTKSKSRTLMTFLSRVPLLLWYEPMHLALCFWSALVLSVLYLWFVSSSVVFSKRGFKPWSTGLTFVGILIGMILAMMTVPFWASYYRRTARNKFNGKPPPEERLVPAMVGAICCPLGLLLYALTLFKSVHWIVPIILATPYGFGFVLIYTSVFTFCSETYRTYSASAMSGNALVRCTFACGFVLFGVQMYHRMGDVGASLFLFALNMLVLPLPFVFYRYGPRIRKHSRFSHFEEAV